MEGTLLDFLESLGMPLRLLISPPMMDITGDLKPWLQGAIQGSFLALAGYTIDWIRWKIRFRRQAKEIARLQAMVPATAPPP